MQRAACLPLLLGVLFCLAGAHAGAQTPARWKAHDMNRPRPSVVTSALPLPVPPPSDAKVLFDGGDLRNWCNEQGGDAGWIVKDGYMESVAGSGYVFTRDSFGDVQLHVEWAAPVPAMGEGQGRGNSGVFLMGLYEVQVLDSFDNITYTDGQASAVYGQYPPLVNASHPPGEWQSYDIVFRRPRFRPDRSLDQPGRFTVFHNGILVQNNVEAWGPTSWLQNNPYESHPDRLPLSLQDHGNPVRYRNIWVRELREWKRPGPAHEESRPVITLKPEVLDRYAGTYRAGDSRAFVIRREGLGLVAQIFDRPNIELLAHSEKEFSLRWTAARMVFDVNAEGVPTKATLHVGRGQFPATRTE